MMFNFRNEKTIMHHNEIILIFRVILYSVLTWDQNDQQVCINQHWAIFPNPKVVSIE